VGNYSSFSLLYGVIDAVLAPEGSGALFCWFLGQKVLSPHQKRLLFIKGKIVSV
jgi:hypothetical protein